MLLESDELTPDEQQKRDEQSLRDSADQKFMFDFIRRIVKA